MACSSVPSGSRSHRWYPPRGGSCGRRVGSAPLSAVSRVVRRSRRALASARRWLVQAGEPTSSRAVSCSGRGTKRLSTTWIARSRSSTGPRADRAPIRRLGGPPPWSASARGRRCRPDRRRPAGAAGAGSRRAPGGGRSRPRLRRHPLPWRCRARRCAAEGTGRCRWCTTRADGYRLDLVDQRDCEVGAWRVRGDIEPVDVQELAAAAGPR
jgi:hypothetical protein